MTNGSRASITATWIKFLVKSDNARKGFVIVGCVGGCDIDQPSAEQLVRRGVLVEGKAMPEVCKKCLRYDFTELGMQLVNKHRTQKPIDRS